MARDPRDEAQDKVNQKHAGVNGVEQSTSRRLAKVENTVAAKRQKFSKSQLDSKLAAQKKKKNGA